MKWDKDIVNNSKFEGIKMRQLFEMDLHDYEESDSVFRRPSARGIILTEDNEIALVYSEREKYYKFPGGGIHRDEDKKEALIREVREEVGLVVIPESICEFGSVMRRQKSNISPHTIFEQENFYFTCKVKNQIVRQNLDNYEAEAGFMLRVVDLDEAINVNSVYKSEDYFNQIMIDRERKVLEMIKDLGFEVKKDAKYCDN